MRFNGVKVFSVLHDRTQLGERVTEWMLSFPEIEIVDVVVTHSHDSSSDCIAVTVFYWEPRTRPRATQRSVLQ